MNTLLSLYIACAIFGVGVTIIDMLGILGDLFHEGDQGDDGDAGHDGDIGHDGDVGHDSDAGHDSDIGHDGGVSHDAADHGDMDAGVHGDHGSDAGHDIADHGDMDTGVHGEHGHGEHHDNEHGERGSVASHEHDRERSFLLQILSIARGLVHFSVGFGPVGLVALATGRSPTNSLAWSIPVGLVTCIGGRLLRRIQRSELDSQLKEEDLIMEQGVVSVSIKNGQLGKVRIRLEGTYAERFARAKNPQENFPVGSQIRIVDVAEDCVYVEND